MRIMHVDATGLVFEEPTVNLEVTADELERLREAIACVGLRQVDAVERFQTLYEELVDAQDRLSAAMHARAMEEARRVR